jgi:uncharacterized protein YecT (DUF1311 family)
MRRFIAGLASVAAMACAGVGYSQTQMELNRQASDEFQKADRQLNAVYTKLTAKLSPETKKSLQAAQLTWIRFRDQECDFETMGTVGGSIHGMMVVGCRTRLTEQRTRDLERQLNCQEGDLSCVHG